MLKTRNQITENQQPTLTPSKGEHTTWRTTATLPRRGERLLERQAEASASSMPQDLGKLRGHACRRLNPLGEPGKRKDLGSNPKGRIYLKIALPGGIDKTEGREEMSARKTL